MPEVTTRFLADQAYSSGFSELSSIIFVDDDIRALRVVYDRGPWTNAGGARNSIAVSWVLEMSRNGRPWRVISEGATHGGVARDETNSKIFRSRWRIRLPRGRGQINRRMRVTTNISQDISTWGDLKTLLGRQADPW